MTDPLLENAFDLGNPWDGPMVPNVSLVRRCHKVCHATRADAKLAAKHIMQSNIRPEKPLGTYWCHECAAWHLTKR